MNAPSAASTTTRNKAANGGKTVGTQASSWCVVHVHFLMKRHRLAAVASCKVNHRVTTALRCRSEPE